MLRYQLLLLGVIIRLIGEGCSPHLLDLLLSPQLHLALQRRAQLFTVIQRQAR